MRNPVTLQERLRRSRQAGVTLIELMVSLVIGLIILGAVLTFVVSAVRANSETVVDMRLTQDLRTTINLLTREIRRTGYDRIAEQGIASGSGNFSRYLDVAVNTAGDCIVMSYNQPAANASDTAVDAKERKGFRLVQSGGVGVIEAGTGLSAVAATECTAGTWTPLTDPRQVDISTLDFSLAETCIYPTPARCMSTASEPYAIVRSVDITLEGALVRQPDVVRRLTDSVRIRADTLHFPTPAPAPTP